MRTGFFLGTNGSGITRYVTHLIEHLLEIDHENEYYVYADGVSIFSLPQNNSRLVYRQLAIDYEDEESAFRCLQVDFPHQLRQDRIDLLHTEFFGVPINSSCPTVVTLHDLIPLSGPESNMLRAWRRIASQRYLLAAQLADRIIVPSRYVKEELVKKLNVRAGKINQIHWGCSAFFQPISREIAFRTVLERFRISRPYLLTVGLGKRKNPSLLIRAFRKRKLWKKFDLVFVGKLLRHEPKVLHQIEKDSSMHYLGVVSDLDLLNLYGAAECLVFPSQMEGFGFPPLEAMACGTPVIASRCSGIPEIIGDAGVFVKPGSIGELADSLEQLLSDKSLQQKLRKKGLKQAQRFQWKEAAHKHLAVYRNVIESSAKNFNEIATC